jgi:DNA end-binding protein Ku
MNPVGNKQVNKATGQELPKEEIVKGYEYDKDQYVTISDEEIKAALPRSTQTIEIESFIDGRQIPAPFFNKPYYVAPAAKGEKPYKLLLETMKRTGRVGVAKLVISTRQHLAALIPAQDGLVLELLRWSDEVRDTAGLPLPDKDTKVTDRELKMAEQLVGELEGDFKPEAFHDEFRDKLQQLVDDKVKAGEGEYVSKPLEGEEVKASADVIDLTELLRKSLRRGAAANDEEERPRRKAAATKSNARAKSQAPVKSRKKAA